RFFCWHAASRPGESVVVVASVDGADRLIGGLANGVLGVLPEMPGLQSGQKLFVSQVVLGRQPPVRRRPPRGGRPSFGGPFGICGMEAKEQAPVGPAGRSPPRESP